MTTDRLTYAFDDAGRPLTFTSRDTDGGTSMSDANIVNRVMREYNGFGQLVKEYQAHDGDVTGSTPVVQYAYSEDTTNNHSRMTSMTYPNGRVLHYNYDTGLDSDISRLTSLSDGSGGADMLESYTYLGLGTVVQRSRGNGVDLTHIGTPGDGGDQYAGLDRFGRIATMTWTDGTTDADSFAYGYDRNGNRTVEENLVSLSRSEGYEYDDLNRLTDFARGYYYEGSIVSPTRDQRWNLDVLGNMPTVTTNSIAETRTHDSQNRLTDVGSDSLNYSANGEMTANEEAFVLGYDAWGRLVYHETNGTGEYGAATFVYDALNRRILTWPTNGGLHTRPG